MLKEHNINMEMYKTIGILIGFLLIMLGVILIYDARKLSQKWFNFFDNNSGAMWFKIGGFLFSIIGVLALFFINKN